MEGLEGKLRRVWWLRRAGVALYALVAAQGLWLACQPSLWITMSGNSLGRLVLQCACAAVACAATAWSASLAMTTTVRAARLVVCQLTQRMPAPHTLQPQARCVLQEHAWLPQPLSALLRRSLGGAWASWAAGCLGRAASLACWQGFSIHAATTAVAAGGYVTALSQGHDSLPGVFCGAWHGSSVQADECV